MNQIVKFQKMVDELPLPENVEAGTLYFVRKGAAFEFWLSSDDGLEVLPLVLAGGEPVPELLTAPTISPASAPAGTVFTVTYGTYNSASPVTVSGTLTQAGQDVTVAMVGNTFVSTVDGALQWSEIAVNSGGASPAVVANATIDAPLAVSALYGISEGQITLDVSPSATPMVNLGGWGTARNLTYTTVPLPTYDPAEPEWLQFTGPGQLARFSAEQDFVGHRLFIYLDPLPETENNVNLFGSGATNNRTYGSYIFGLTRYRANQNTGTWKSVDIPFIEQGPIAPPHLLELDVEATRIGVWVNAVFQGWAPTEYVQYLIRHFGAANNGAADNNSFTGRMGRIMTMRNGGAADTVTIAAIRAAYASMYSAVFTPLPRHVDGADNGVKYLETFVDLTAAVRSRILVDAVLPTGRQFLDLTVSYAALGLQRYDTWYWLNGVIDVAQGQERIDPEQAQAPIPAGAIPLVRASISATTIREAVAMGPLIGGVHHTQRAAYDAEIARARAAIPNTLAKIQAGLPITYITTGDSIYSEQSGVPSTATADGPLRDRIEYLLGQSIGTDITDAIPRYTAEEIGRAADGAGQTHTRTSAGWGLADYLQAERGYSIGAGGVTNRNFAIAAQNVANWIDNADQPTPWLVNIGALPGDLVITNMARNNIYGDRVEFARRMVIAVNYLKAQGKEVLMNEPPLGPNDLGGEWEDTIAKLRQVAVDTGTGVIPIGCLYAEKARGGHVVNRDASCGLNRSNHPSPFENVRNRAPYPLIFA